MDLGFLQSCQVGGEAAYCRPWQGRHQFSEQDIEAGKVSNDWKESRRFEKNGERAKHIFDLFQKFLQKMLQAIPLMFFHGIRWIMSFSDPAAILFPVGFILRTAPSLSALSHSLSSSRKEMQVVGAGAISSGWDGTQSACGGGTAWRLSVVCCAPV